MLLQGKVYAKLPKEEWVEGEAPLALQRELEPSDQRDPDRLVPLLAEVVREGHSALVFCQGRKSCEMCARMVAEVLPEVRERWCQGEIPLCSGGCIWHAALVLW